MGQTGKILSYSTVGSGSEEKDMLKIVPYKALLETAGLIFLAIIKKSPAKRLRDFLIIAPRIELF